MRLHVPRTTASLKQGEKEPREKDTPRSGVLVSDAAKAVTLLLLVAGVAPRDAKSAVLQNEPMNAPEGGEDMGTSEIKN